MTTKKVKSIGVKVLMFGLFNLVSFFSLKSYLDNRQVRMVTTLLPSVVKVQPVGPLYFTLRMGDIVLAKVRIGFGVMGHGSGVFIDKNGLIVTCNHVVAEGPLALVQLDGPRFLEQIVPKGYRVDQNVPAYVVGRDIKHDVALLRLCKPLKGIKPVSIATSVKKGLPVFTIGFPGPFHKYVTAGIISGSRGFDIYSDLVINPGNSGGGVFNCNGELVGLARFILSPSSEPIYAGLSGLTNLRAIRELVEKYKGF